MTSTLVAADWDLVGEALPPQPDNPRGYWEPKAVVEIHDDFLSAIGSGWSDPTPLPCEVFFGSEAKAARRRLEDYVERLVERPRWILKDPRLCRLLPLWRPLLTAVGAEWRYLFVVRYPRSVAASLEARDRLAPPTSMALWLRHYLEAEKATRGEARHWISFEDWMAEGPRAFLDSLSTWLPETPASRLREAHDSCVAPGLVHHREGGTAPEAIPEAWVARAWNAILALSRGGGDGRELEELEEVADDLAAADELLLSSYTSLPDPVRARWSGNQETTVATPNEVETGLRSVEELLERLLRRREEDALTESIGASLQESMMRQLALLGDRLQSSFAEMPPKDASPVVDDLGMRIDRLERRFADLDLVREESRSPVTMASRSLVSSPDVNAALGEPVERTRDEARRLCQQLAKSEAMSENLAAELAERTAEAASVRGAFEDSETQRQQLLSELAAAAAELRDLRAQLSVAVAARDAAMAGARKLAADRDALEEGRRERESECRELADQVAILRQKMHGLATDLAATEARLDGTLNQLSTVTASRSWRWTAPTRRLLEILSR